METPSRPQCLPVTRSSSSTGAGNWRGIEPCAHFVQFYATERDLIEPLAEFVSDGIWQSERVVIIASAAHRAALEAALRQRNVDLASALSTQQVLMLDAADTLAKFHSGGRIDRSLFMSTVGALVRRATADGRKLRAFGEMVALLWAEGNRRAAIELENLWNDLSRDCRFSLFCAYPAAGTTGVVDGISLADICSTHNHVIPA